MKQSRLAKRKLGIKPKEKKKKKSIIKRILLLLAVILVFLFFIIWHFNLFSSWNGKEKISVVIQDEKGNVFIRVLDPSNSSITNLSIPPATEVQAAMQLGTWKIGSITRLGKDKKLDPVFLKNTVIKSFNFPIDEVADVSFLDLTSGDILKEAKAILQFRSMHFGLLDKLRLAIFSSQVSRNLKFDIDLTKTNELEKVSLIDGSLGYKIAEEPIPTIQSYFTLPGITKTLNLLVNNAAGSNLHAALVSRVVETLGLNVASITTISPQPFDCKVTGILQKEVSKIAHILSCEEKFTKANDNFDIQIDIGEKFKNRF